MPSAERHRIVFPDRDPDLATFFEGPLRPRLESVGELAIHGSPATSAEELGQRMAEADAGIFSFDIPDEALRIAAAGRLRVLAFTGTGASSFVNVPLARELGVTVCNVVHYGDIAVAEQTLALLVAVARDIVAQDAALRRGDWAGYAGTELAGKTVGLVGFGGIGQAFARQCAGLGMKVLAWSRHPNKTILAEVGGRAVDLDLLLASSDVVSLHLALTPQTAGIITPRHLDLLKPGSIFLNTARAQLIAPGTLAERLRRGDVRAGLDVFDKEPLPLDDPLLALPGVVLTPHLGFRTPDALERLAEGCVADLEAFFAGEPVNVVD